MCGGRAGKEHAGGSASVLAVVYADQLDALSVRMDSGMVMIMQRRGPCMVSGGHRGQLMRRSDCKHCARPPRIDSWPLVGHPIEILDRTA